MSRKLGIALARPPVTYAKFPRGHIQMTRKQDTQKDPSRTTSAEDQAQLIQDCLWLFPEMGEGLIRGYVGSLDDVSFCSHQTSVLAMTVERGASPDGESMLRSSCPAILDALVRLDCGFGWKGTEPEVAPSAGNVLNEAFLLWARKRRERLEAMSGAEIAQKCRAVLDAKHKSEVSLQAIIAPLTESISRSMSATAKKKYRYVDAFIAAGRHLRTMRITPQEAWAHLKDEPYEHYDSTIVSADPVYRRIIARRGGDNIGSNSEGQFGKNFMKKSFPGAAAGGKGLPGATAGGKFPD
jgi:hypothetical protein